jgi:hypothetical protein
MPARLSFMQMISASVISIGSFPSLLYHKVNAFALQPPGKDRKGEGNLIRL